MSIALKLSAWQSIYGPDPAGGPDPVPREDAAGPHSATQSGVRGSLAPSQPHKGRGLDLALQRGERGLMQPQPGPTFGGGGEGRTSLYLALWRIGKWPQGLGSGNLVVAGGIIMKATAPTAKFIDLLERHETDAMAMQQATLGPWAGD